MGIDTNYRATRGSKTRKIIGKLLSLIINIIPLSMAMRANIYRLKGVNIGKDCLLGKINIDGIYPSDIYIGEGTTITKGTILLTHFYNTKILTEHAYTRGEIHIGKRCYIGVNTIFTKPVTVGDGAVIGAGSVITKDIPPYEVWAGVPARFIAKRCNKESVPRYFKPK